jgi:hypothetical protein
MKKIVRTLEDLIKVFHILKDKVAKEPLMIDVEPLFNKRTSPQLRSFWLLIRACKVFMNSTGNNFTDEEVSYYFKIKANHCTELDGVKMAKSISDKSLATKEQMENLINTILDFGAENEIDNCEITSSEMQELLKYYDK